ncbi:uncharacterized protein BJ212DRAFT_1332456, partial [Suillus subaureus]
MSSEESLRLELEDLHVVDNLNVYDRFSKAQKNFIVFAVSFAGLLPMFITGSFVPSIPQIAHDLNSTGGVVRFHLPTRAPHWNWHAPKAYGR